MVQNTIIANEWTLFLQLKFYHSIDQIIAIILYYLY